MPNNAGEADTHDLATAYEPTEHERAALKAYFARDETCPPAPRMKVIGMISFLNWYEAATRCTRISGWHVCSPDGLA
jgi:hypothetical protein